MISIGGVPNPKQELFLQADTRYVAYGGARGGGKSWAVRAKALLLCAAYPGIKILIVRKTLQELRSNHLYPLLSACGSYVKYRELDKTITFPNGSTIHLGYCDSESDVLQYQGQEYDTLFIDEGTHLSENQFKWLDGTVRNTGGYPCRTYITCNPGGVGHDWVKREFVDEATRRPNTTFIKATVYDNKALMENDPEYVEYLESLDEQLREFWLNGNWDYLAGQYFSSFSRDIHVCKPFGIPSHWKRYRALDYGLDALACLWVAVNEIGDAVVYRETVKPDYIISESAKHINELTDGEEIEETYAPPDLWGRSQESGKSRAEIFRESGLHFIKSNNNRVAGWQATAEWLKPIETDEGKSSRLRIFNTCPELIRCLPQLQRSQKDPSDCATEPHDITHICDALRYFCVQRPSSAKAPKKAETDAEWLTKAKMSAIKSNTRRSLRF